MYTFKAVGCSRRDAGGCATHHNWFLQKLCYCSAIWRRSRLLDYNWWALTPYMNSDLLHACMFKPTPRYTLKTVGWDRKDAGGCATHTLGTKSLQHNLAEEQTTGFQMVSTGPRFCSQDQGDSILGESPQHLHHVR